jgi:hypothetical protein
MRVFASVVVAALLLAAAAAIGESRAAAQSAPATFYGRAGVTAGEKVEASIGGTPCGATTVNAANEWALSIPLSAACQPTEGAPVTFTVDGKPATVTPAPVWKVGGTPPDIANGYKVVADGAAAPKVVAPVSTAKLSGGIPLGGGFGLIVLTNDDTLEQLVLATGCPKASMALYATADGGFVPYVPGTVIGAVNAHFLTLFAGGYVKANTAFVGRCK